MRHPLCPWYPSCGLLLRRSPPQSLAGPHLHQRRKCGAEAGLLSFGCGTLIFIFEGYDLSSLCSNACQHQDRATSWSKSKYLVLSQHESSNRFLLTFDAGNCLQSRNVFGAIVLVFSGFSGVAALVQIGNSRVC